MVSLKILKLPIKTTIAGLFLTLILGGVFFFFNQERYFDGEDWGTLLRGSLISSFQDCKDTFKYGHIGATGSVTIQNQHALPHSNAHFLNVFYRPFLIILYKVQFLFFGTNPYGYFFLFILLHIIIALCLFYTLTTMTNLIIAFSCSLFFGFHPTLYGWIGKLDCQQHVFSLLLCLIALFFFKKNKFFTYIFGCLFFLTSLLTRETFIILPLVLIILSTIKNKQFQDSSLYQNKQTVILITATCLLYLLIRYLAYPIQIESSHSKTIVEGLRLFCCRMSFFFHHLLWNLSFPWNTYLIFKQWNLLYIYNTSRLILCTGIVTLFFYSKEKMTILTLLLAALLLCWPIFIVSSYAALRFYYEALPFFIIAQGVLLNSLFNFKNYFIRIFGLIFISFLITFNATALIKIMHAMTEYPRTLARGLKKLKSAELNQEKAILIFNAPSQLSTCCTFQALQLLKITKKSINKFHYCHQLNIHSTCQPTTIKEFITLEKTHNSITLISSNINQLYFSLNEDNNSYFKATINQQVDNKIQNISLFFDEDFLELDAHILLWIYENETFLMI